MLYHFIAVFFGHIATLIPFSTAQKGAGNLISGLTTAEASGKLNLLLDKIIDWGVSMGGRLLGAIVIFIVGRFVIRIINKLTRKLLSRRSVDRGVASFISSLLNALLMVLLIVAVINKIGIETTSFAALLASFGVAIGMAMSGNLSNLVGGMIILLFRPYKVDDWISVQDVVGKVKTIEIFHTVLITFSGEHVYFSNGTMSTAVIKNYSQEGRLRVEVKVSVDYGQNLQRVSDILLAVAKSEPCTLADPAPAVLVNSLADSSVEMSLRLWVDSKDYWDCQKRFYRLVYDRFQKEGISIPFPQLVLHHGE